MKIQSTYPLSMIQSQGADKVTKTSSVEQANAFADILMQSLNKTNEIQKESELLGEKLITGEINNIHDVTIANQKAELALELTVSVTNKILDAYNEIMRLQL